MTRLGRLLSAGSLARALAEVGIIVAGVLIALAADEWRQARDDTRMAASYRAALIDDLVADSTLYDVLVDQGWFQAQADAVDSLQAFLADEGRVGDPITLTQWMTAAGRVAIGRKESASFDDLSSSGRLALLGDPALRRALLEYHRFAVVLDERAYEVILETSLRIWVGTNARLLGPTRIRAFSLCEPETGDASALLDPALRDCLERSGAFDDFDLGAALRRDIRARETLSTLQLMRELGLRGATTARNQATELRAMLRDESR